jgi:tRNA(fMet)-specific endonuclease VapC
VRYIFDTGIIVGYVRDAPFSRYADQKYQPLTPPNMSLISAVSKGEIYSLAFQFGWGDSKRRKLSEILMHLPTVEINRSRIIDFYAEIDAFSQGKHPTRKSTTSSRNMGKNDIWIAATTAALGARLVTVDHDFDHLQGEFFEVIYIDQKLTPAGA